jgi:hypothetical protein
MLVMVGSDEKVKGPAQAKVGLATEKVGWCHTYTFAKNANVWGTRRHRRKEVIFPREQRRARLALVNRSYVDEVEDFEMQALRV